MVRMLFLSDAMTMVLFKGAQQAHQIALGRQKKNIKQKTAFKDKKSRWRRSRVRVVSESSQSSSPLYSLRVVSTLERVIFKAKGTRVGTVPSSVTNSNQSIVSCCASS